MTRPVNITLCQSVNHFHEHRQPDGWTAHTVVDGTVWIDTGNHPTAEAALAEVMQALAVLNVLGPKPRD